MAMRTAIEVEDLRTAFGTKVIHDGLSFSIGKGEVVAIVGGSGTGKSVLLREMLGLMKPAAGTIRIDGREMARLPARERQAMRGRMGVLFQNGALFSSLSVCQNIQVPLKNHFRLPPHLLEELSGIKLALSGLPPDAAPRFPAELSGGMKKRAGLARALALDPDILFLDEPTAGLDPIGAAAFDDLIRSLQRSLGLTVVMITHDLDSLTRIADRIVALVDKRAIVGTLDELRHHDHPWLKAYFGGVRGRAALAARPAPDAGAPKATEPAAPADRN